MSSLRDELASLSRERDEIELLVEAASSRLRAAGVGMDKPLVDAEVRVKEVFSRGIEKSEIDRKLKKKTQPRP